MKRGKTSITTVGSGLTTNYELVIEQPIGKLTPDMLDWWWDNIKDTARYHRWHPTAHQTFTWTMAPKNSADLKYDVGAVQQIVEVIGNPTTLDITWLDPANVPITLTYDHFVYGSTMLDGTPFGGFLLHEYAAQPEGWYAIRSSAGSPLRARNAVPAVLRAKLVRGGIPPVARALESASYSTNLSVVTMSGRDRLRWAWNLCSECLDAPARAWCARSPSRCSAES
jgi:hypothetical protein